MKMIIALVGMRHRGPDVAALVEALPDSEPLTLIREPTNKYDASAVQVWARDRHVGYLKGSQNKPVANWMDTLRRARQSDVTLSAKLSVKEGRWPFVEVEF